MQKTLGLIKPNATKQQLEDFIFNDINRCKFNLTVTKARRLTLTREQASEFYSEHENKVFFGELLDFMTSGEIIAFVVEGENAVSAYREVLGNTDPKKAEQGTIRAKYATLKEENTAHGSDSLEAAEREIKFFFGE